MLNSFAKFTRKLRIDNSEILKDMANKLNVTSSYLSAVELSKRPIPDKWGEEIRNIYQLSKQQYQELLVAIDESRKDITLNLSKRKLEDRDLILSFARKFDDLDEEAKTTLKNILR